MKNKKTLKSVRKVKSVDRGFLRLLAAVVDAPEEMVLATVLARESHLRPAQG